MLKINIVIFSTLLVIVSGKIKYDNYKLYNVLPVTEKQFHGLKDLERDTRFDFWSEIILNENVKVMVSPKNQKYFEEYIHDFDMEGSVVMKDVQQIIDEQTQNASSRTRMTRNSALGSLNWEGYNNLDQIYAWLDELEDMYSDIVTVVEIGTTGEGRPIKGIIIDYQPEGRNETLIGMYEGGIHAREWISPATVTWIIKEFLTSTDPEVRGLARNFVWHIFPVVNPDGYEYTFTQDRMWRKNRNTNFTTTCLDNNDMSNGIDLNRNFGFQWSLESASDDPCSNLFAGPQAFSELESLAISAYVHQINSEGRLIYYIAFHSYSQLMIIPYSHLNLGDPDNIDNYADLYEIGIFSADAIEKRYDTRYRVGLSTDVMYAMSGTSFDWVKSETDVPLCYLFELRDVGDYGFLLPQERIIDNNLEIMDGLIEIDRKAKELGYYSNANNSFVSLTVLVVSLLIFIQNL